MFCFLSHSHRVIVSHKKHCGETVTLYGKVIAWVMRIPSHIFFITSEASRNESIVFFFQNITVYMRTHTTNQQTDTHSHTNTWSDYVHLCLS